MHPKLMESDPFCREFLVGLLV